MLKQFEKRDYIVTVSISALNVKKTSKVYKAKKLDNPLKNLGENEPAELKTAETVDHTMETVGYEFSPIHNHQNNCFQIDFY